ncbi:MAG: ORF6N domain-containing protein [Spartobacteria bacterium]
MKKPLTTVPLDNIRSLIHTIRGEQVMLDSELAEIYGVEPRRLNEQVKRNIERFPEAFRFQLTEEEYDNLKTRIAGSSSDEGLRSQNATLEESENLRPQFATLDTGGRGKHRKYLPYAFTEQGVSMLSAVLRSETAVKVSIQIIHAFVEMRRFLQANASIFARMDSMEKRQFALESKTMENFEKVFQALEATAPPKQGIFYDGQVHDAYAFVSELIRKAKKSLVLIDNYIDDSVLTLLTKRKKGVAASIFTQSISKQLALDLDKHNAQYPPIQIHTFKAAHDRFLILDESDIYHIGASLKDLGKKWFAFSKFETGALDMLRRLGDEK